MKTYMISYDLHDAGSAKYAQVNEAFGKFPSAKHLLGSTWKLDSENAAEELLSEVRESIGDSARIVVAEIVTSNVALSDGIRQDEVKLEPILFDDNSKTGNG